MAAVASPSRARRRHLQHYLLSIGAGASGRNNRRRLVITTTGKRQQQPLDPPTITMDDDTHHRRLLDDDWHYVGEGNSSLVLASRKSHLALRLRKPRPTTANRDDDSTKKTHESEARGIVGYVERVWRVVRLDERFAQCFGHEMSSRRLGAALGTRAECGEAILMPLLSFLDDGDGFCPTFMVEIKPKEATLPESSAQVHPIRRRCSKYQLKQLQKLDSGAIERRSAYDPPDLFSNDRERIVRALAALIQTPQNNFRLFRDGALVYADGHDVMSTLLPALAEMFDLVRPSPTEHPDPMPLFLELMLSMLQAPIAGGEGASHPSGASVLVCLKDLQERLAPSDVEELYPSYLRARQVLAESPDLAARLRINASDYATSPFWTRRAADCVDDDDADELVQVLSALRDFLVAATWKDCSLTLTFRRRQADDGGSSSRCPPDASPHGVVTTLDGLHFEYRVHLVDLDPKPFDRIERYYREAKQLERLASLADSQHTS